MPANGNKPMKPNRNTLKTLARRAAFGLVLALMAAAIPPLRAQPLHLGPDDVLPTGNEWISLPDIRAVDGALDTFNVLSMQHRGLLQVAGDNAPAIQPYFGVNGQPLAFRNPAWDLIAYWTPRATLTVDGLEATLTWCTPPGSRGAFLRMTLRNRGAQTVPVTLGVQASFGSLSRVTYVPVTLRGERSISQAPWVSPGEAFSYITSDTEFSWALIHPGSTAEMTMPPLSASPATNVRHTATLKPGESTEALFVLGVGVEEFAAAHAARALREMLDRDGADALIEQTAAWCRARTRTTGQPGLDLLMNRNFLFTELYAWGRTLDTEEIVGVTSRSPRYYVSAAYWDRDAMLWSFPALLDIDKPMARLALTYALTTQLRNTGTHSRFLGGGVLEDGFQLDEAAAPIVALASYAQATNDVAFLSDHRPAITLLQDRLLGRFDAATGLYSSLQDSQDEFQILPFLTYDNVLVWKSLLGLADIYSRLHDEPLAQQMTQRAQALHAAILAHCIATPPSGSVGPMFASATDGKRFAFTEIPPGSLLRLPELGFLSQSDPTFANTYQWLHSPAYQYAFAGKPYGLPGSYRLLFTTSWGIADHLTLDIGRERALKILRASDWDGGIITEGVSADTGKMDQAGRAFATAAGYMAHAICRMACTDR
jgi:hypothetical protein